MATYVLFTVHTDDDDDDDDDDKDTLIFYIIDRNYSVSICLTITSTFQIGMPNKRNIERKFYSLYAPSVGVTVARELLRGIFKSRK